MAAVSRVDAFVRLCACLATLVLGALSPASAQCTGWTGLSTGLLTDPVRAITSWEQNGETTVFFSTAASGGYSDVVSWNGTIFARIGSFRNGGISALATHDDGTGLALYVGGVLGQMRVGNQWVNVGGVAKWNGSSWSQVGTGITNVLSLVSYDFGSGPKLFAGGRFTRGAGGPGDRVAYWDGTAWRAFVDEVRPDGRWFHAMAYDAGRQRVVMFGGLDINNMVLGDTWEWDGTRWRLAAATGPAARMGHSMVFDPARGKVVLFGGAPSGASHTPGLSDMWEWNGSAWAMLAPPASPPGRLRMGACFDSARSRLVVNGGESGVSDPPFRDTWEWDSATNMWAQVSSTGPQQLSDHAMAYNSMNGRSLLFGGLRSNGATTRQVWDWEPLTAVWTQLIDSGPSARRAACFVADPLSGGFLLYGGSGNSSLSTRFGDFWHFSGTSWTQRSANAPPGAIAGAAMAFDAARHKHVLFGGTMLVAPGSPRDTWLYDGTSWTKAGVGEPDGDVLAMCVHDDGSGPALYIAGPFDHCGPLTVNSIAKWTGSAWQALGSGVIRAGTDRFALTSYTDAGGPALFIGAPMTNQAGDAVYRAAKWRSGVWTDATSGLLSVPQAFGTLTVGEAPTLLCSARAGVNGQGNTVYGLSWNGSAWQLQSGGIAGELFAFHTPGGPGTDSLYAGGQFSSAGGAAASNICQFGNICSPVYIIHQPDNVVASAPNPVTFTVSAIGTGPFSYEWRRDGTPLSDTIERNHITGSHTETVTLRGWSLDDAGFYDCVVTGALDSAVSDTAELIIPGTTPTGPVDVDTLALLPQQPPGYGPGNSWFGTRTAALNVSAAGNAIVCGSSSGPDIGTELLALGSTADSSPLAVIADSTDVGPTPPGFTYMIFQENSKALANGDVMVAADMQTNDTLHPCTAILRRDPQGAMTLLAATNESTGAPDEFFASITHHHATFGEGGHAAFVAQTVAPSYPFPIAAQFVWSPEIGLTCVARAGDILPGSSDPVSGFNIDAAVAASGLTWFLAGSGLYQWDGQSVQKSLIAGDSLPGSEDGEIIDTIDAPLIPSGEGCVFHVRFHAPGNVTGKAMLRATSDDVTVLLRSGHSASTAPEPGVVFTDAFPLAANSAGMVVFRGVTAGPCGDCSPRSMWLLDGESISLISWGPVRPAGWQETSGPIQPDNPHVNARGEVILTDQDNHAMIGWTQDAGLFTIAAAGTQIEVSPGHYRTVAECPVSLAGPSVTCLDDTGGAMIAPSLVGGGNAVVRLHFNDFLMAFRPCPSITRDPQDSLVVAGQIATLTVAAGGESELTYAWKKDGQLLSDGLGSLGDVTGASTEQLVISNVHSAAQGDYDVIVSNSCGTVTSARGRLSVHCFADFNLDGGIDGSDVEAFFESWSDGRPDADVNGDGGVDGADVETFFAAWQMGGC